MSLLNFLIDNFELAEWTSACIAGLTLIAAGIIAYFQNRINSKLTKAQTSAILFAYSAAQDPNTRELVLRLTSAGSLALFINGYEYENEKVTIPGAVIPANQGPGAWYDLKFKDLPDNLDIKIFLSDDLGRNWLGRVSLIGVLGGWRIDSYKLQKL